MIKNTNTWDKNTKKRNTVISHTLAYICICKNFATTFTTTKSPENYSFVKLPVGFVYLKTLAYV